MKNEEHRRKCQAAVEKAIDAIMEVVEVTECAGDRYKEAMERLLEDELIYREEIQK